LSSRGGIGWSQSTVSRLESGLGYVTDVVVTTYLAHCGVSAPEVADVLLLARETEDGYLVRRSALRTVRLNEAAAVSISSAAPLLIPGLLQIEQYTRALMSVGDHTESELESRISARAERQRLLKRRQPPQFTYFIYEAALRCPVGGNRVMNEQMLHLAFLAGRPQVTIRVVPFSAGSLDD
jgi:hypothetical protein